MSARYVQELRKKKKKQKKRQNHSPQKAENL